MRKGFTVIELLIVLSVVSIMLGMALPKMRVSPLQKVKTNATQLMRDLELSRTRALNTKKGVRMVFEASGTAYQGYLDENRDGMIEETNLESQALGAYGKRFLSRDVGYGRGNAGPVPGETGSGAITFDDSRLEFDDRGVTKPFGTRGTVYLVHRDDPNAVAAIAISGSASFKVWIYRGGEWQ